jgi:hypothetical protein
MNLGDLRKSLNAGIVYLLEHQFSDGHWEDFDLPVGRSDGWVTAFVGLALATVDCQRTNSSAAQAAAWLCRQRPYPAGWGYNSITGPDSDSTGCSLLLLRTVGQSIRPEDENWLMDRWQPGGGFATYPASDGWGIAHPDVTPVAFRALSHRARHHLRSELIAYLLRSRLADGTWPAYWWRTRHYSTFLNSSLARDIGVIFPSPSTLVSFEQSRMAYSAFDTVYILANALLAFGISHPTSALAAELLDQQESDGNWAGSENLRVMRHDTSDPWNHPNGDLYADIENLITTASAVRILATLAALWK